MTELVVRHYKIPYGAAHRFPVQGDMQAFGVYAIRNILNGWEYIGDTGVPFERRWRQHIGKLLINRHHCKPLQEDWNKYGPSAFHLIVLYVARDYEELEAGRESEFMRQRTNLYNMQNGRLPREMRR